MAGTTTLNTRKFCEVNQCLTEYFNEDIGHDIHTRVSHPRQQDLSDACNIHD